MKGDELTEECAGEIEPATGTEAAPHPLEEAPYQSPPLVPPASVSPAVVPPHRESLSFSKSNTEADLEEEASRTPTTKSRSRVASESEAGGEISAASEDEEAEGFTHEGQPEYEQDDPLAPGFDIEEGTPLNPEAPFPLKANVKNAKEFFGTEVLYRFDILEDDARQQIAGRYRIELKGFQGGIWTLVLADSLEVLNRREDAEIVLSMQQRDFLQLVNGQLNPQLAMFAQKMRVTGDLRKAVAFQAILVPSVD